MMEIEILNNIQWPEEGIVKRRFECAGASYCEYYANAIFLDSSSSGPSAIQAESLHSNLSIDRSPDQIIDDSSISRSGSRINLLEEEDLSSLDYYQVLDITMGQARDKDLLKKAYRKACLTYHPDKTGRATSANDDDEDEVFILIKTAYDTLRDQDKRRAYDSSMPFDDSIPSRTAYYATPNDFFGAYRPVFERNLRFAVSTGRQPPDFGDDLTPIEQVNKFYDYWIKFESWRDFSLKASELLKYDVDTAEDRYEKRYMEKEIERKAKGMKKEEMGRITSLVENAMAADPRLRRHKEEVARAKVKAKEEKLAKERARIEAERQQEEEEDRKRNEQMEAEKAKAAANKQKKEQEKKALRKSKQLFRKLSLQAHSDDESGTWGSVEEAYEDIEFLCDQLTVLEINTLNIALSGSDNSTTINVKAINLIKQHVDEKQSILSKEKRDEINERKAARKRADAEAAKVKAANASMPWSREEISALAKAVKKYPAGGANRWDTIANFINNLLKPENPRTKEECINQFNLASSQAPSTTACASNKGENNDDVWTQEQDQLLQEGLAKYPSSMDKNERWTSIAKLVKGKTKKQCVTRFKAIREALKNKSS